HVGEPVGLALHVHERPPQDLPAAQEQREVLGVQARLLTVAIALGADAGLTQAPGVNLLELTGAEARHALERLGEGLARREDLVPEAGHGARLVPELPAELLEGAA